MAKNFKTSRRSFFCIALIISTVFCSAFSQTAKAAYVGNEYITSAGACVMNFESGEVIYEYNGYSPRVPASMTKIMTLYCVYEAMENNEIALNTHVPISSNVYYKSRNKLYQNMVALNQNTTYTVDEILGIVITYSASAATVALAELVGGGSEAAFVNRMNETAARLGISAKFYDSCGVANNRISPVGMATLARNAILKHPDILTRAAKKSVTFKGTTYKTTNYLLDTYYYPGADGLKTGTGSAAGACFCGTAMQNGIRLITVTMGSSSSSARFTDTARLLNYGFAVMDARKNTVFYTNMRTFVNGAEMPTFYCNIDAPHALIIAEDMANYGFDVTYDDASRKLFIQRNGEKAIQEIPLEIYKNKNGQKAFSIKESNISVVLKTKDGEKNLSDAYNVDGYICISIDQLANYFDFSWNNAEMAASISDLN